MVVSIDKARLDDAPAIAQIYNEAVVNTVATFDTEPVSDQAQRDWLVRHGERHPVVVARSADQVIGWASLSAWSDRCAYDDAAELSVYIRSAERGRGVGRQLAGAVLDRGRDAGIHTVLVRIESKNEVSLHIMAKLGFKEIGVMRQVGYKFGRRLDVTLMQLIYDEV